MHSAGRSGTSILARPLLFWGLALVYLVIFGVYVFRLRDSLGDSAPSWLKPTPLDTAALKIWRVETGR